MLHWLESDGMSEGKGKVDMFRFVPVSAFVSTTSRTSLARILLANPYSWFRCFWNYRVQRHSYEVRGHA